MTMDVHYSSEEMTWETPQDFFDKLNKEFNFSLDPCCVEATAKCERYYTPEEDGLAQNWEGETVFMNPPYGKGIKDWMHKAAKSGQLEDTTVVCLVPSRTDTCWWQDTVFKYNADVRFVKGRLKFGGSKNSAPFPSAVVIFNKGTSSRMEQMLR